MQKKLLFNIVLLLLVNLLVKPFWILGIDRGFQNLVGYESYGLYVNMFNISIILTMLLDFGINNFNSSTIANNPEKLSSQFSSLVTLKILLSVLYLAATLVLAYFYGYHGVPIIFIMILATNQVLAHFSTFVRSCITGIQLFKTDALLSAVDRFTMIILGVFMLQGIFFPVSIYAFIGIQSIGYLTVLAIGLIILVPKLTYFNIHLDWGLLKGLLVKTAPYALLAFIMLLYTRTDVLLIKKLLTNGDLENGIYASGGRLLEASNMMIGATAVIMLPFFARMIAANENLTAISKVLVGFMMMPVVVFALTCHIYHIEIMQLLSPGSSIYTAKVFSILILAFIPYGLMYTFGSMLTAKAEMKILNWICGIALVVNLILNLLMIPRYGALGAAYAALATQCIVGFGKFIFAIHKLKLSYSPGYYLKFIGFIGFGYLLLTTLHHFGASVFAGIFILIGLMLCWLMVFKMIDFRTYVGYAVQKIKSFKR